MRLFILTIILAALACLLVPTLPAFAQDADSELIADLQKWLIGSWLCQYSPSMKAQAIYGADKQFEWIFRIGRPPYVTVIRQMGSYDVIMPGNDGYQAAVLATVERTLPEDPEFEPGKQEQADFTRAGANTLQDSNGECVRRSE